MSIKIVCQNKKARHDFFIDESLEAGLALSGVEVKSLRAGRANLKGSFARIKGEEVFLHNVHISPYLQGDTFKEQEPTRTRKLLLHKREIRKLIGKTREKGYTLVPLKIYFKRGRAKVELGLARGKKHFDKRAAIKEKDVKREISRAVRSRAKGD